MTKLTRFVAALVVVGLFASTACGGGTSAPSPAPSKSTAPASSAPASPAPASTAASSKPSASAPASQPAQSSAWQAEWDQTLAAAKKEGKLILAGAPGDLYRQAALAFEKAYPDIKLEFSGATGSEFLPKVSAEREGGQYLWDVHQSGWNTPLLTIPKGVFDPIKPAFILPEVKDDSKWLGGVEGGFADKGRTYEFTFSARVTHLGYVNRDVVPESQLSTVDQLLDPRWKGKISAQDPRLTGPFSSFMGYLLALKGEDWFRKLLTQDLVVMQGGRPQAEALVRGQYPIGLAVNAADIEYFKREGLMASVKTLAADTPEGRRLSSGFGNVLLMNRAPHPNAAKIYINWLLSQQGQKIYTDTTSVNSRRLDVTGPADTAPDPKAKYEINEFEESPLLTSTARAIAIAKEVIR